MRGWLLAAFQDLETITNEVEVHGIILREVLGTRFFSLERIEVGLTHSHTYGVAASLRHCLACSFILHMHMTSTVMYDHSVAFLSVSHVSKMYIQHMNSTLKTSSAIKPFERGDTI